MIKYKKIVLDFETTGLSPKYDEILQVSAIDQDGNVLINEYCKPKNLTEWEEAEEIHGISPAMVKDKKPFEDYVEFLSDILTNAAEIIIYNVDFEKGFLNKYGVQFNDNFYDLMIKFAETYGEWNDYWENYTWQKLSTCCTYYGYYLKNAHDSLEDCKATLYCYNKEINKAGKYKAQEYLGVTVEHFINEVFKNTNTEELYLFIEPIENNTSNMYPDSSYFHGYISSIDELGFKTALNSKIRSIEYRTPVSYSIKIDNVIEEDYKTLKNKFEWLENQYALTQKREEVFHKEYLNIMSNNMELKGRIKKLEKQLEKFKEKLGLSLKNKDKIPVYNSYGFYTAEYCRTTKKPMLQQSEYGAFKDVLLSKTRCKQIKKPVREGEEIYAFLRVMHGYCALYYRNVKEGNKDD